MGAQQSYRAVSEMRRTERLSLITQRQLETAALVLNRVPRTLLDIETAVAKDGQDPDSRALREAFGLYEQLAAAVLNESTTRRSGSYHSCSQRKRPATGFWCQMHWTSGELGE